MGNRKYFSSFQFPLSSHGSIVCFWPLTVWSVLISHGGISFDQSQTSNLSHHQTSFPFPDYPQPSWLQTDAVSENLTIGKIECSWIESCAGREHRIDHRSGVKTSQSRGMARERGCTKLMEANASERRQGIVRGISLHLWEDQSRLVHCHHLPSTSSYHFSLQCTQPILKLCITGTWHQVLTNIHARTQKFKEMPACMYK